MKPSLLLEQTVINLGPQNANLSKQYIVHEMASSARDPWRKQVEKATKDTIATGLVTYIGPYSRGGIICTIDIDTVQYTALIHSKADCYPFAHKLLTKEGAKRCEITFNASIHFELGFIFFVRQIKHASGSSNSDNLRFSRIINNRKPVSNAWTEKEDQVLLDKLSQDIGIRKIATRLDKTTDSIVQRMLHLGVINEETYHNIKQALANL